MRLHAAVQITSGARSHGVFQSSLLLMIPDRCYQRGKNRAANLSALLHTEKDVKQSGDAPGERSMRCLADERGAVLAKRVSRQEQTTGNGVSNSCQKAINMFCYLQISERG